MTSETTYLYYTEGSSDKVYQVYLEARNGGFVVRGLNGRRGGALKEQLKTPEPVPYDQAKKIYDKLVLEKTRKGYTPEESGQVYQSTDGAASFTGHVPQLLNPATENARLEAYADTSWVAQEKYDGERRMIEVSGGKVRGINRKGMSVPLPANVAEDALLCGDVFLDGEIIGDNFFAFDVLSIEGVDLRQKPYSQRYKALLTLPSFEKAGWAVSLEEKNNLEAQVREKGGEGVVLKDTTSLFTPGRPASGGAQLKYKFTESATLKAGEKTSGKRSVALYDRNDTFVGKVTVPENHELPDTGALVEVGYLYRMPREGALYQPVYKGARTDKTEADDASSFKEKPEELRPQKRKMT